MSEYTATLRWRNDAGLDFSKGRYSRVHSWEFDGGITVPASSSPQVVRVPMSSEEAVDPEEAFVASIASCHMLSFLWVAAKRGFVVESYEDEARGTMSKNAEGKLAITSVDLNPRTRFSGEKLPDSKGLDEMHHEAHELCFIASSVKSEIRCHPFGSEMR
jgi:organic hydroperoxide reductase OsmC/OhrA